MVGSIYQSITHRLGGVYTVGAPHSSAFSLYLSRWGVLSVHAGKIAEPVGKPPSFSLKDVHTQSHLSEYANVIQCTWELVKGLLELENQTVVEVLVAQSDFCSLSLIVFSLGGKHIRYIQIQIALLHHVVHIYSCLMLRSIFCFMMCNDCMSVCWNTIVMGSCNLLYLNAVAIKASDMILTLYRLIPGD